MTTKDYIIIARVLRETQIDSDELYDQRKRKQLARAFATELRKDNERFDEEAFIRECGAK